MNKTEFIKCLETKTNLSNDECNIVNNILENHFLIGKNNKAKIIEELKDKLNLNQNSAEEIYNTSMQIISSELKNKIKHPFKSKD